MANLDVSPLVVALRSRPSDFEFEHGWLRHLPSRHGFKFDSTGNVSVDAHCDCSRLSVAREQGQDLWATFKEWRQEYWWPIEVNREFASHFRPPNAWERLVRSLHTKWRLRRRHAVPEPAETLVPAE